MSGGRCYFWMLNGNKIKIMKFKGSIEIAKSRDEVVKFFADPNYLGEYQDGFIKKDLIKRRIRYGWSCIKNDL